MLMVVEPLREAQWLCTVPVVRFIIFRSIGSSESVKTVGVTVSMFFGWVQLPSHQADLFRSIRYREDQSEMLGGEPGLILLSIARVPEQMRSNCPD
jgi:hypothetical protein